MRSETKNIMKTISDESLVAVFDTKGRASLVAFIKKAEAQREALHQIYLMTGEISNPPRPSRIVGRIQRKAARVLGIKEHVKKIETKDVGV